MIIRRFTRDDIPSILTLNLQAFYNDELRDWLYTLNAKSRDANIRRYQLHRLRMRYVSPASHGCVAVSEPSDTFWSGTPEIVGVSIWNREGNDEYAEKWKQDSLVKSMYSNHSLPFNLTFLASSHDLPGILHSRQPRIRALPTILGTLVLGEIPRSLLRFISQTTLHRRPAEEHLQTDPEPLVLLHPRRRTTVSSSRYWEEVDAIRS